MAEPSVKISENATRPESFRSYPSDSGWIDEWTRESGQDRAMVLRAAIRHLRATTSGLDFEARARFIAALSVGEKCHLPPPTSDKERAQLRAEAAHLRANGAQLGQ